MVGHTASNARSIHLVSVLFLRSLANRGASNSLLFLGGEGDELAFSSFQFFEGILREASGRSWETLRTPGKSSEILGEPNRSWKILRHSSLLIFENYSMALNLVLTPLNKQ